jgi:hypothetical protein
MTQRFRQTGELIVVKPQFNQARQARKRCRKGIKLIISDVQIEQFFQLTE